jgi:hypothetical protein
MKTKLIWRQPYIYVASIALLAVLSAYCALGALSCPQQAMEEPISGQSSCAGDETDCTSWFWDDAQRYCEDLPAISANACKYCGDEFERPTTKRTWHGACAWMDDPEGGYLYCDASIESETTEPTSVWDVDSGTSCATCGLLA